MVEPDLPARTTLCASRVPPYTRMMTQWNVRHGSIDDIELLAPLWVAVHHQHIASMPDLAPYVGDEETWSRRSALYRELLAKPDTIPADCDGRRPCDRLRPGPRLAGSTRPAFSRHLAHGPPDRRDRVSQRVARTPRKRPRVSAPRRAREAACNRRSQRSDSRRASGKRRRDSPVRASRIPIDVALSLPPSGTTRTPR